MKLDASTLTLPLFSLALTAAAPACHDGRGATQPESGGGEPVVEEPGEDPETGEAEAGYPGELVSTDEIEGEFMARQKLSGSFGDKQFRFEAVLQMRDGTLTVLGLTPFGTKAFLLEQRGTKVEFKALIDREIPFPPEYMLQDIHRTWFWHARLPWGASPPSEDPAVAEVDGERVTEQWSANGLVRRSFERLDGAPEGSIRVDYMGGHREGRPAKQVVLDNGWFGYRLEIETVEWRRL